MFLTILVLVFLLLCSSFFSGSETSMMSVGRLKARFLVEQGEKRANTLLTLLENPNRLLTTILIGNNIVNIAASSIATAFAIDLLGPKGTGVAAAVMTVLVLIFGEILPKTYAAYYAEKTSLIVAGPIYQLSRLLSPLIAVFTWLSGVLLRFFGSEDPPKLVTAEEIRSMVSLGHQEGVLESAEGEIIHNVFEFTDTIVQEIMIPRPDLTLVDAEAAVKEAASLMVEKNESRLAVFEEDKANIIGVVHIEDVLAAVMKGGEEKVRTIMRSAFVVPETKPVGDLFEQMRKERISSALVVDEYGTVSGMVTLDELVEDIVGELQDEHYEEEGAVTGADGDIILHGSLNIAEANELLDLDLPDEHANTLGGWLFHTLGRLPKVGDVVRYNNMEFRVDEMERWRISRVRVTKENKAKKERMQGSGKPEA